MAEISGNPALVLSLALATGINCQILARHLRIPGIVVLLGAGALLGLLAHRPFVS